jgi:hypothetical protein
MRSAVLLLVVSGCVYASKVSVPGAKAAFRIHCQSQAQCAEKAGEVCAGEYAVITQASTPDGYANNGTGYANSPLEMTVACKAGGLPAPGSAAVVASAAASVVASAAASPPPPADGSACAEAFGSVQDTAAFWAQLHPDAKRLAEPPSQRDFIEVCRAVPERVQRCLDARYRAAHDKPCLAILRRLEPAEKNRVDSLFLE